MLPFPLSMFLKETVKETIEGSREDELIAVKETIEGSREDESIERAAYATVSKALDLDLDQQKQGGTSADVVRVYTEGARLLQDALDAGAAGDGLTSADVVVVEKRRKMRETLKSVCERIDALVRVERRPKRAASTDLNFIPETTPVTVGPVIPMTTGLIPATVTVASKKIPKQSKETEELWHRILDELMLDKPNVPWDSVIGLVGAKQTLYEIVVLPHLRPDLFFGLRSPARGVLLFGPPGTGKTLLAKAVATASNAHFFAISASTLTSRNYGDGEKLVRALFHVARHVQPSIIFIDEIDSILASRSETEHEASRRLKTEFLLQFDGVATNQKDSVFVLGATNRPQEIDQGAIRRLTKRIYIPLPDLDTRILLIMHLLAKSPNSLTNTQVQGLAKDLDGYSSSDITALAKEAALGPLRDLGSNLLTTKNSDIRPISYRDFKDALKVIRPSVSQSYVTEMEAWNKEKGVASSTYFSLFFFLSTIPMMVKWLSMNDLNGKHLVFIFWSQVCGGNGTITDFISPRCTAQCQPLDVGVKID